MTNKEAIKYLNTMHTATYINNMQIGETSEVREALDMAISALEKQMPKKLVEFAEPKIAREFFGICPNCDEIYNREYPKNFCHKCGQALDWSEDA